MTIGDSTHEAGKKALPMEKAPEGRTSRFYDDIGWQTIEGVSEDARRWEDLREYAQEYVSKCRLRVSRHMPTRGDNMLDMASGPIQYDEYLEYSKTFEKRYCVDLSVQALEEAGRKLGDRGVFLHGSFFDIQLQDDFFDCSVSLHTIYHIDKDKQEEAVRKLIRVTRPGKPVIIVYSNPNTLLRRCLILPITVRRFIKGFLSKIGHEQVDASPYFFSHPLGWWSRFSDVAEVRMFPWRSFASHHQKILIPNNRLGKTMFNTLFGLEERFPEFFVRHFQYPIIVLTKKTYREAG